MNKNDFYNHLNDRVDYDRIKRIKLNALIQKLDDGIFLYSTLWKLNYYKRKYISNPAYTMSVDDQKDFFVLFL